ncbi:hypothetical protein Trydic_g19307 [Trypoxylus dichotomus]
MNCIHGSPLQIRLATLHLLTSKLPVGYSLPTKNYVRIFFRSTGLTIRASRGDRYKAIISLTTDTHPYKSKPAMRILETFIIPLIISRIVLVISVEENPKDPETQETKPQRYKVEDAASYHDLHRSNGDQHEKQGYQSRKKYSKGDHGRQGASSHKDDYGEEVLKKDDRYDEANHYDRDNEEDKTVKSAKFGEREGHRRGHKTRGYHNKFFKDEYHREHKFYDNYRRKGHFKKRGDYSGKQASREGGHRKGGNRNSSFERNRDGKEGHYDKGHYEDDTRGRNLRKGNEKYYIAKENHGRRRDAEEDRQHHYRSG